MPLPWVMVPKALQLAEGDAQQWCPPSGTCREHRSQYPVWVSVCAWAWHEPGGGMFLPGHLLDTMGTGRRCPGSTDITRQSLSAKHREMFPRLAAWFAGATWLLCPGPAPGGEERCLGPRS